MSATNATTNYALPIFIGTDKPAWLVDWNSAMTDIDAAIKGVDTDVQGAITSISGLSSTVASHTSSISTITGQITVITTNLNNATGNINTINSLIGNGTPTTTDQTLIGAINELHANQGDLADLTTPAVSLVAAINAISGGGAVAASAVSYDNNVSGLTATNVQAAIDELAQGSGAPAASAVTYDNTASGLTATNVQAAIDDITVESTSAKVVGVDPDGKPIYEKIFKGDSLANNAVLDASLTYTAVAHFEATGCFDKGSGLNLFPASTVVSGNHYGVSLNCTSSGLVAGVEGYTVSHYYFKVRYSLNA